MPRDQKFVDGKNSSGSSPFSALISLSKIVADDIFSEKRRLGTSCKFSADTIDSSQILLENKSLVVNI